ncbi:hypothetical protein HY839_01010 [Candidatus Azambacteria bacterium]|nr:hypothetical protein [Candidatus Azambacteria bacterium]
MIEYKLHVARQALRLTLKSFAIAIVSVTALIFLAGAIARTTDSAVRARNDFTMLTKKFGAIDQLTRDNDSLAGVTEKLESAIPTMDDLTRVEEYLTVTAVQTTNDITMQFSGGVGPSVGNALAELPLTIQLSGTQKTLSDFLRTLESAPYLISVKSVSLSFSDSAPDAVTAQIAATLFLETNSR